MPGRHGFHPTNRDKRYDLDDDDFPRGDTYDFMDEDEWYEGDEGDGGVDVAQHVAAQPAEAGEEGGEREGEPVVAMEEIAISDRTAAAHQRRTEIRARLREVARERRAAHEAAILEVGALALEMADCALCPLIDVDNVDAARIRALYSEHLSRRHEAHSNEDGAGGVGAEHDDEDREAEEAFNGEIAPRRFRDDGTPVFGLEAVPSDVLHLIFEFAHPVALVKLCYTADWLRREAEESGVWELLWKALRLRTSCVVKHHTASVIQKVQIVVNWTEVRHAHAVRDKLRRYKDEGKLAPRRPNIDGDDDDDDAYGNSDDEIVELGSLFDDNVVLHNDVIAASQLRTWESLFHLDSIMGDGSARSGGKDWGKGGRTSNTTGLPRVGDSGRAFPWSSFLSLRYAMASTLVHEWQRWADGVDAQRRVYNSSWASAYTSCSTYHPPDIEPGSGNVTGPGGVKPDSAQHTAILRALETARERLGSIGARAWLEVYRAHRTPRGVRLYAAFKANEAAGHSHRGLEYAEQIDFQKMFTVKTRLLFGIPPTDAEIAAMMSKLRLASLDRDPSTEDDVTTSAEFRVKTALRDWRAPAVVHPRQYRRGMDDAAIAAAELRDQRRRNPYWFPPPTSTVTPAKSKSTKESRLKKQIKNVAAIGAPTTDYERLKRMLHPVEPEPTTPKLRGTKLQRNPALATEAAEPSADAANPGQRDQK